MSEERKATLTAAWISGALALLGAVLAAIIGVGIPMAQRLVAPSDPTPTIPATTAQVTDGLVDGDIVALRNMGHLEGPRWLDGRTGEGTVGLAPEFGGSYTGTRWQVVEVSERVIALKNLGHLDGPRWLDGRTGEGTVGLAPQFDATYTGARWELVETGDDIISLKSLGHVDGPRWLDGRTEDGTVALATDTAFSGTQWETVRLEE